MLQCGRVPTLRGIEIRSSILCFFQPKMAPKAKECRSTTLAAHAVCVYHSIRTGRLQNAELESPLSYWVRDGISPSDRTRIG